MTISKKRLLLHAISFFIPAGILILIFACHNITPFGNSTLLAGDLELQCVPFMSELSNKLHTYNYSFYSWSRCLGFDFLGEATYYLLSPLNIILIFFNNKTMPVAISLLTILKCSLAGFTMSIYLRKHFFKKDFSFLNILMIIAFSNFYALSAYMVNYFILIMWLDCVILLPLIILSLERLFINKKPFLFSIYLSMAIFSNYYIGYMICLFCVLYFVYLIFEQFESLTKLKLFKIILRFTGYSLLSGTLCMVIILPQLYILSSTASNIANNTSFTSTYYSGLITAYRFLANASPHLPLHPYLYCGDIILLLLPLYLFNKEIPIKQRIIKFCITFFIILSIRIPALELIWNGFHKPNGYVGRFSFLAIFLILIMSFESILKINAVNKTKILLSYVIVLLSLFAVLNVYLITSSYFTIIRNVLIISLYTLILIYNNRKLFLPFLSLLFIIEAMYNANSSQLLSGISYTHYLSIIDKYNNITSDLYDNSFYRIKNDTKEYKNQGSLCNYKSIATVSSTANDSILSFLSKLGYFSSLNAVNDVSWEPVFGSILGEKYIISYNDQLENDTLKKIKSYDDYYLYENKDSLSLAFEVNNNILNSDIYCKKNPFEIINAFANVLECDDIYSPASATISTDENKIYFNNNEDIYLYSKELLKDKEFISQTGKETLYPVNLLKVTVYSDYYSNNYIYHIASSKNNGYIELNDNINPNDIISYCINQNNYEKLMKKLSKTQLNISNFDDGYISGTIDADENGIILTSIPYSKGWTIKLDGKKVNFTSLENALITFDIKKGTHSLEFSYFPVGLKSGFIITMISLAILILCTIYHIKQQKRSTINNDK